VLESSDGAITATRFDVFLSYRRADAAVPATLLRRMLQAYRLPKELDPDRKRSLRVFVDKVFRRSTSDFFDDFIRPSLEASDWLVVVATKQALQPHADGTPNWVEREIEDFLDRLGRRKVIVARVDGELGDPLPGRLHERFERIDIADFSAFRISRYFRWPWPASPRAELLTVVAAVLDIAPDQMPILRSEEQRQRRRLKLRRGLLTAAFLLLAATSWWWQGLAARSALRAHDATLVTVAQEQENPTKTALLREVSSPPEGWAQAAHDALTEQPFLASVLELGENPGVFLSPDGATVLAASPQQGIRVFSFEDAGQPTGLGIDYESVRGLRFSSNGERFMAFLDDSQIQVFSRSGRQLGELRVESIQAEFGTDPATVYVLETGRGQIWRTDEDSTEPILLHDVPDDTRWSVFPSLSPDGSRLLAVTTEGVVCVWNLPDGSLASARPGGSPRYEQERLRFTREGTMVILTTAEGINHLWRLDTPSYGPVALEGSDGIIWTAASSPDRTRVVTGGSDGVVRVWDTSSSGPPLFARPGDDYGIQSVAFTPDGSRVITVSEANTVRIWSVDRDDEPVILHGFAFLHPSAGITPDGRRILTAPNDQTARIWDTSGNEEILTLRGRESPVMAAGFDSDGSKVFAALQDGAVFVWDLDAPHDPLILNHEANVWHAELTADGTSLLTASEDGNGRLWSLAAPAEPILLAHHGRNVWHAAVSPVDSRVLTASADGRVLVWNTDERQAEPLELDGHRATVRMATFSPDGSKIATASWDETARVWSNNGSHFIELPHKTSVDYVSFSPDGTRVATASRDEKARIWSAETAGEPLELDHAGGRPVSSVHFSPNGRKVLTLSSDNTARVWDSSNGQSIGRFVHGEPVGSGAFSPDGRYVATAASDARFRLWNLDGTIEYEYAPSPRPFLPGRVAFSSDGTRVLYATNNGEVRVWSLDVTSALWRATAHCVPVDERVLLLGENEEDARRAHEDCQRRVFEVRVPSGGLTNVAVPEPSPPIP